MTTVLARANRGPGLITIGPVDITGLTIPATTYIFTPIVLNAVRDDATLIIPVTLQLSFDGGLNWTVIRDESLHFGIRDRNGTPVPPALMYSFGGEPTRPTHAKGTMNLPRVVSIGWDLTLA